MTTGDAIRFLAQVSLKNIPRHRSKSLIVGSILFFGTALVVLGNALLDSVQRSMEESVTSSISGQLQVYSGDAKDELQIFGGMGMTRPDIGSIPDWAKLREVLTSVPNVKTVVPMGIDFASANAPADLDQNLTDLRAAVKEGDPRKIAAARSQVQQVIGFLSDEFKNLGELSADVERQQKGTEDLARAISPAFWEGFEHDPLDALEFLENAIAPLGSGGRMLYMRYVGTDLDLFARTFDRLEIVSGQMVPPGKRGLLLSQKYMDDWVKNQVARELDKMKKARAEGKLFATDVPLQEQAKRNVRQYQRVLFQLDPDEAAFVEERLRALLPGHEREDLAALLQAFLQLDDSNFDARYAFFYEVIAPRIRLYDAKVGDILTLTNWTRSGYVKSVNVMVYGTFRFRGVEDSQLAGSFHLADLATFRDLLGLMTAERKEELDQIRAGVGVKDVKREDAEAALFGDASDAGAAPVEAQSAGFDEDVLLAGAAGSRKGLIDDTVSPEDLAGGVILNAAVILADPEKLEKTRDAIVKAGSAAGLKLNVVDWQSAAGIVGQFILVVRLVLYTAILIIFVVAMVIINNTMVMATMERVSEIGTMRAIGAHRSFVLAMFLVETLALGLIAGGLGAAAGAGLTVFLGVKGIPAPNEFLTFLFGGPRLYPTVSLGHLFGALFVVLVVSLVSTFGPARIATRIQPIEAMRSEE